MDGIDLTKKIREHEKTLDFPEPVTIVAVR